MDGFIELLKILIPAAAVFATTYFVVKKFLDNEQKKREMEARKASGSALVPIRLQAYERIIIFLERLHPNSLVLRVNKNGYSAQDLQLELIKTVRSEYEHNLSQQIYMSAGAWEMVKNAKEETLKLVNMAASKASESTRGQDLAGFILQVASGIEKMPSQLAIDYIKKEITKSF